MDARYDAASPPDAPRRPRSRAVAATLGCGLALIGIAARAAEDPAPPAPARPAWPAAIILEPPATRADLLDKLRHPDLVIWDGATFDRWAAIGPTSLPGAAVIEGVRVAARVAEGGGQVSLRVRFRVALVDAAAARVPIGLDGLVLGRVDEGGRDLPVISLGAGQGWGIELVGQGGHVVEVEATAPAHPVGAGAGCDLAIPPAATTEVELIADRPLVAARVGPGETLTIEGATASGHVGPRPRLELTWEERDEGGSTLAPILVARGELAVTVGLDAIETRESWSVRAVRGATREIHVRLAPGEQVTDVQVDGRPAVSERRVAAGATGEELVIPLAGPLAAPENAAIARGATIGFRTRRPGSADPAGGSATFTLAGHPIVGARGEVGAIAVARPVALALTPVEGRGVRRVDPTVDLPPPLRGPADAVLGFEFAEQPFDLGLRVEPIVPRFEVAARSTVLPRGDRVEVTTRLAGRVWQGRLFDLRVLAPPGLVFEPTASPTDGPTIRSERRKPRGGEPNLASAEILIATFPRPIEAGGTFVVTLRGGWRLPPAGAGAGAMSDGTAGSIGLFQPLGTSLVATEVALVSTPERRFDPLDGGAARFARLDPAAPPADWAWPAGFDPAAAPNPTWLRADSAEAAVPVRLAACPRSIRHRSTLALAFDRAGADAVVDLAGEVSHGTIAALEIALPPEVGDRWVAEAGEALEHEALDLDPATGWRRYRLPFSEPADSFQVRIRYRLEFGGGATGLRVRPIRILDGASLGQVVRLSSEPDVTLAAEAPGWDELPAVGARGPAAESVQQVRRIFEHASDPAAAAAIVVTATLGKLADLPTLVASRLWLLSAQMPGGGLATSAQYRLEVHARSVVVRLPAGSRWVRGVAGAAELAAGDVEQLDPDTYRITLPSAVGSGPAPLRVDSILDRAPADGTWPAPELVGGVVQVTAWELSLLGTRAGVGVPAGWADENTWYRDGLLWKRRPRRAESDLARWLADGGPSPARTASPGAGGRPGGPAGPGGEPGPADLGDGHHAYLFSRPGPPTPLHFPTWARPTLLLVCSGPVLLVGLLVLARRPPPRWVAGGTLALGLAWAALIEPNAGLLVAESSSVGFALAGIAALIHRTLDRRARPAPGEAEPVVVLGPSWDDRSATSAAAALAPTTPPASRPPPESGPRPIVQAYPAPAGGSTGEFPIPPEFGATPGAEAGS